GGHRLTVLAMDGRRIARVRVDPAEPDGEAPSQDGAAPSQDGAASSQDAAAPSQDAAAPSRDGVTPDIAAPAAHSPASPAPQTSPAVPPGTSSGPQTAGH
ncbi:MAG: hypothetical protein ACRDND_22755, partial [Streptosporangiaceae bacterium]